MNMKLEYHGDKKTKRVKKFSYYNYSLKCIKKIKIKEIKLGIKS